MVDDVAVELRRDAARNLEPVRFRMYTVFLQEQAVGERLFLNTMIQYATIIIVIVDEINWTIC